MSCAVIIHLASRHILEDAHIIKCSRWRQVQFQKLFLDIILLRNLIYEGVNILPSWQKPVQDQ